MPTYKTPDRTFTADHEFILSVCRQQRISAAGYRHVVAMLIASENHDMETYHYHAGRLSYRAHDIYNYAISC